MRAFPTQSAIMAKFSRVLDAHSWRPRATIYLYIGCARDYSRRDAFRWHCAWKVICTAAKLDGRSVFVHKYERAWMHVYCRFDRECTPPIKWNKSSCTRGGAPCAPRHLKSDLVRVESAITNRRRVSRLRIWLPESQVARVTGQWRIEWLGVSFAKCKAVEEWEGGGRMH